MISGFFQRIDVERMNTFWRRMQGYGVQMFLQQANHRRMGQVTMLFV